MNVANRAMFLAGAFLFAYPLTVVLAFPWFATGVRIEAALVLVTSLVQPAIGLLTVATLAPLGEVIFPILGAQPPHHAEVVVIAFLVGWLAVRAFAADDRAALPSALRLAVGLFATILAASVLTTILQYQRADPPRFHDIWQSFKGAYLWTEDPVGVHAAMNLIEGLCLMAAAAWVLQRRPAHSWAVPIALVAGGVVSAAATVLLAYGISSPAILARQAAFGPGRYSAAMQDLNAAGSYYLLIASVGIGIAVSVRRMRVPMIAAALLLAIALFLTGSRAALLAGSIVLCAVAARRALRAVSPRAKLVFAGLAVALLLLAGAVVRSPSAGSSLEMRSGFTRASLNLITARPLFGVGEGRYYYVSSAVLPPPLAWAYGQENAHNYFLQLAAELGLTGAGVFAWVMIEVFRGAVRGRRLGERQLTVTFAVAAAAFLLTCVVGHPFLVAEAAFPFWIVAGLLSAIGLHHPVAVTRTYSAAVASIMAIVLATIPTRTATARLGLNGTSDGFGPWHSDPRGPAYRETHAYASVFVERTIDAVELPVRAAEGVNAVVVGVALPGATERDAILVGQNWNAVRLRRPPLDPLLSRWRVNLWVSRAPGEPVTREPGVYVGRVRIASTEPPRR